MTRLVAAELLKIRSTRMWWGLLVGALLLAAVGVVATLFSAGRDPGAGSSTLPGLDDPAMVRSIYGAGAGGAFAFALVLGVFGMAGEYRHKTITPSLLAVPRRGRLVAAKFAAYAVAGVGYGAATALLAVAIAAPVLAARGHATRLTSDGVPLTLVLSLLGVAIWAIFGLGLGTLLRNQIAAVLVALGVTFVLEPILSAVLRATGLTEVGRFLPSNASSAMLQAVDTGQDLLPWWGGALVLAGYGAVAAALGVLLTVRRDVT